MADEQKQEPVAWAVDWGDGDIDCEFVFRDRENVEEIIADNDETKGRSVPLYRYPQPVLTDEEREAIAWVISRSAIRGTPQADRLRGLLEKYGDNQCTS